MYNKINLLELLGLPTLYRRKFQSPKLNYWDRQIQDVLNMVQDRNITNLEANKIILDIRKSLPNEG